MIFLFLSVYLWMIVLHELGHFLCLKLFSSFPKNIEVRFHFTNIDNWGFKVGQSIDYKMLNKYEKQFVYMVGIILGTLPMIIASYYNIYIYLLFPLYLIGCTNDIVNFVRLFK